MTDSSNTVLPPCSVLHGQPQLRLELLAGARPELDGDAAGCRGLQHTSARLDGDLSNIDSEAHAHTLSHLCKVRSDD